MRVGFPAYEDFSRAAGASLFSARLTDGGLLMGHGSALVRMKVGADGLSRLMLDQDRDRLHVLSAIVGDRPLSENALRHVEAAAADWWRGDKALANLRLVFADLPRLRTSDDADRLALAAHLLDHGMTPFDLKQALELDAGQPELGKYWEDQPRVAAGHGRESGQWTNAITVAMNEGPPENEEERKEEHVLPSGRPQVTVYGGRVFDPLDGTLSGAGTGKEFVTKAIEAAAQAKQNVGPGRGPAYGTAVHTEFKRIVGDIKDPAMRPEQSYLNGTRVDYGTPGSVRFDCIIGAPDTPTHILDLKTGSSKWTPARERVMRSHLPEDCRDIPIYVVRP